jgi:predicted RNA-binding Zn-ribbon protein involved in translation (DUF1610 family)
MRSFAIFVVQDFVLSILPSRRGPPIAYTRLVLSRKCPKCGRVALIRIERTFKADEHRMSYSCSACGASWTTSSRPERKPPKRKHAWLA